MFKLLKSVETKIADEILKYDYVKKSSLRFYSQGETIINDKTDITAPAPLLCAKFELSPQSNSFIRVEVWLPEKWNGDFLGTGNGGMAGGIPAEALSDGVKYGFAAATTDMGTSRGMKSGIKNPAVHHDFGHRATHLMTQIGKAAVRAAYGENIAYSFFKGGSTGGEQALSEAQIYPDDYDAILCGAPANNRIRLHTYFLWNFVHLKTDSGTPLFDKSTCEMITQEAVRFARSSEDDNFISLPPNDAGTISAFVKHVTDKLSLTEKQSLALAAVYNGPTNPKSGENIYDGMPLGSEMYSCGLYDTSIAECSPHDYPFFWAFGETFNPFCFDFDKDFDKIVKYLSPKMDANSPNLAAFFNRGGKLLMVSGSADPCVPFFDALHYARSVEKSVGKAAAEEHFRFYIVPSADHRAAGCNPNDVTSPDGRDLLEVLTAWRKGAHAPEALLAYARGYNEDISHERLIYPMPLGS